MFFLMGVHDQQRQLDFTQTNLCTVCGRYGRYEVFMTCMVFTLFFIPLVHWNRRYYVRTTCCGRRYELNPEVGRRIQRGERVQIRPDDLRDMGPSGGYGYSGGRIRRCAYCGYTTTEDFAYCPKCGRPF